MNGCTAFNQPLTLKAATSIGSNFLNGCSSFNKPLTLEKATSIGSNFLNGCTSFGSIPSGSSLPKGEGTLTLKAVTSIGDYFMQNFAWFNSTLTLEKVTSIGHFFMNGCSKFNQPLTLPSTLTYIGYNFLSGYNPNTKKTVAIAFNSPLTLQEGLEYIGDAFLSDNPNFNKPLTIPSTVTHVGTYFLKNCNNMTTYPITIKCPAASFAGDNDSFATDSSSAACYTTGFKIEVPSDEAVEAVKAIEDRFPNSTSKPFRKLIVTPIAAP
jgi:hypothetical protein